MAYSNDPNIKKVIRAIGYSVHGEVWYDLVADDDNQAKEMCKVFLKLGCKSTDVVQSFFRTDE